MTTIPRPALRYFGGKFRLASWIISHFPPHTCYVEACSGAASVLLQKPPSTFEVLNDADANICTFFRVLRERPDDLRRVINLTPYSRAEHRLSCEPVPVTWEGGLVDRDLEQARRVFVRCWQAYAARLDSKPGWRFETGPRRKSLNEFRDIDRLAHIAARLLSVQIEEGDARDVIARYDTPETLHFVDPPYLPEVRNKSNAQRGYRCEMAVEEHIALAGLLTRIRGMAVVCGYPSALYDSLYQGWECVQTRSQTLRGGKLATECLWLSPSVSARLRNSLFRLEARHATDTV